MFEFLNLFLIALLASVIALAGGVIFLYNKKWSQALQHNSIPFAAGVLITVSILGLIPEASEMLGQQAFLVVIVAFFSAYFFEHFFVQIHHHQDDHSGRDYESAVPLVIFGDTIHNFIDGITIGASFLINPGLGLATAVSTFLHEIPHEIGDFGILLNAGWKRKDILIVNILSASTTIAGAFLMLFISENSLLVGYALAVSAGVFLYLGAIDFLPNINQNRKSKVSAVVPLVLGIFIMAVTLLAVPHGHEEETGHASEIETHNIETIEGGEL
jgi:zinc and cadmium transporter